MISANSNPSYQNPLSQSQLPSYSFTTSNGHGGGLFAAGNPYGYLSGSDVKDSTLSLSPKRPGMMFLYDENSTTIDLLFYTEEDGSEYELKFEPEQNMSTFELMRIQLLVNYVMAASTAGARFNIETSIEYIRKHNLERHFRIRQV